MGEFSCKRKDLGLHWDLNPAIFSTTHTQPCLYHLCLFDKQINFQRGPNLACELRVEKRRGPVARLDLCYKGTAIPGNVRTSPISIFIAFTNRSCQADVVCITIYPKLLIIDRDTNRKSSTRSSWGLVPSGHAEPGSDADDVPLLL